VGSSFRVSLKKDCTEVQFSASEITWVSGLLWGAKGKKGKIKGRGGGGKGRGGGRRERRGRLFSPFSPLYFFNFPSSARKAWYSGYVWNHFVGLAAERTGSLPLNMVYNFYARLPRRIWQCERNSISFSCPKQGQGVKPAASPKSPPFSPTLPRGTGVATFEVLISAEPRLRDAECYEVSVAKIMEHSNSRTKSNNISCSG